MKAPFNIDFNGLYDPKMEKKYKPEIIKDTIDGYFKNNQHSLFKNITTVDDYRLCRVHQTKL